ncbi:MAG TPA: YbhB/YbcL family Raf kinase inhibitor-like protein [Kofleriaceae bacterium]|nr:YbhB/YbcL family Raf kinase inhibitor-like protein [Kofleriaceae bacterium]
MRTLPLLLLTTLFPAAALAAPGKATPRMAKANLKVTSSAFAANQAIPAQYTCDGAATAPPVAWSAVPGNTRSVAILVEDPDAPDGTFTHWLVTGLGPQTTSLAAGAALPQGAVAAKNGKGDTGYSAPCPPTGLHHYVFHVYALETTIPAPSSKEDFLAAITGHVLAEGQLIGTYQKSGTASAQK